MAFSTDVQHLQVEMNRFAKVLGLSLLKTDGIMGPKTLLRFKQLAASILAPELYSEVFSVGSSFDEVYLADNAGVYAEKINERANALHFPVAPTDPQPQVSEAQKDAWKAALLPNAEHGDLREGVSPWLIVGGVVLLAGAGAAVYLVARRKKGKRGRGRARRVEIYEGRGRSRYAMVPAR